MQTRRDFLSSATVTLLMIPLAACSSPSMGGGTCNGTLSTSTVTSMHTHTLCVLATDLSAPPPSVTYTSSTTSGHSHDVTLSMQQLQMIQNGQSVTVTSAVTESHTHDFMIMKA